MQSLCRISYIIYRIVFLADRIWNEEIRRMASTSEDVMVRMKKNVLETSWRKVLKKYENPPEGMYEEVDDSGRGERGM